MGTFGSGERYDDNPFVFFESNEYVIQPQSQQDMPNPLRAMYEDLAPLLLRSPPSKRFPQQPTGRKSWDVLTDPISELILTSVVPDPVLGETLQRTMRPTVEGKEGLATHLNILVDASGSMGDGCIYGVTATGFPMAGYHLAQICTAMMIGQAEIAKDTFAVWDFSTNATSVWEGPSGEHKMALDFFLQNTPANSSPFAPRNLTNLYNGLDLVGSDLEGYDFDQCVTIIIMDGAIKSLDDANKQIFNKDTQYNDRDLRAKGPVFYCFIANPSNHEDIRKGLDYLVKALEKEYGMDMGHFAVDMVVTVGEDGTMAGFAGKLVDMARINSGDSDLGDKHDIESAEDAAKSKA